MATAVLGTIKNKLKCSLRHTHNNYKEWVVGKIQDLKRLLEHLRRISIASSLNTQYARPRCRRRRTCTSVNTLTSILFPYEGSSYDPLCREAALMVPRVVCPLDPPVRVRETCTFGRPSCIWARLLRFVRKVLAYLR